MYSSATGIVRLPVNKVIFSDSDNKSVKSVPRILKEKLEKEPELLEFLKETTDLDYFISYSKEINSLNIGLLKNLPNDSEIIINHAKVNNIRRINQYFIEINKKLKDNGVSFGFFESINQRHTRLAKEYWFLPKWFISFYDFLMFRVIPKLPFIRALFFSITLGKNRAVSLAEMLGRLTYCGFDLVNLKEIKNLTYYVAVKKREPAQDKEPSYGPLIKMKRIGKNGKLINVYKFRTMHPYSEYLQKFIYDNYNLKDGGKFKEDFRITSWGKFMRKYWFDEVPMFLNYLQGQLKFVGVRPLSVHYLSLYKPEMIEKRSKVIPGLIPPFYADLPKSLDEIQVSESNYIDRYMINPVKTDFVYFWKAFYNIFIKKVRSS